MSRIGRQPVVIPAGVTVEVAEGNKVTVKGAKGTLERVLPAEMTIKVEDCHVVVTRQNDLKKMKSLQAAKQGKKLVLSLGYSHSVDMEDPADIETVVEGNKIIVKGISKEKVGQYAAEIREKRAPEPYKGKGIKYADEVIRRKVGKTGKK